MILCPPFYDVDIPFVVGPHSDLENSLRDTSRTSDSAGSEIPLPREADFRSDSIVLLGVPFETLFRVKVRVYSADPGATTTVISANGLRVFTPLRGGIDIFTPAYAEFGDFALLPPPHGTTALVTRTITVEPLVAGTRIWAFATATNNETQQITVISP